MIIDLKKVCLLFMFMENWFLPFNFGFDFRLTYLLYFAFIVSYPFIYRHVRISSTTLFVIVALITTLIIAPILGGGVISNAFRQVLLITFNILFCFLLLNAYEYDIRKLFGDYCEVIFFVAVVGIFQYASIVIGFEYGADFSYLGFDMQNFDMSNWRVQSWFQEPSFLAVALLPAAFASVCCLMGIPVFVSKQRAVVILAVLVLSQAASGLVGLVLCVVIIVLARYSILQSPIWLFTGVTAAVGIALALYTIPMVKQRIDDSVNLFFNDHVTAEDINSVNLSTYAIYSNYKIATAALRDKPIFGYGIGSYEQIYDHYLEKALPMNNYTEEYRLNARDANSLLLRITAETGLFGLMAAGIFIFAFRIRRITLSTAANAEVEYWIINGGIFVVILIRLLRLGHYTILGFMLMLMLYYLSKVNFEQLVQTQQKISEV